MEILSTTIKCRLNTRIQSSFGVPDDPDYAFGVAQKHVVFFSVAQLPSSFFWIEWSLNFFTEHASHHHYQRRFRVSGVSENGCLLIFSNAWMLMEPHELPFHVDMDESMLAPLNVDSWNFVVNLPFWSVLRSLSKLGSWCFGYMVLGSITLVSCMFGSVVAVEIILPWFHCRVLKLYTPSTGQFLGDCLWHRTTTRLHTWMQVHPTSCLLHQLIVLSELGTLEGESIYTSPSHRLVYFAHTVLESNFVGAL
jgi:hypothetical protein